MGTNFTIAFVFQCKVGTGDVRLGLNDDVDYQKAKELFDKNDNQPSEEMIRSWSLTSQFRPLPNSKWEMHLLDGEKILHRKTLKKAVT